MAFSIPPLPFAEAALEPVISAQTISFHYGKHLAAYINNTNKLIENTQFENKSLEEIVRESEGALFNNAAQSWNHIFYFDALIGTGEQQPQGMLEEEIKKTWGSVEQFKEEFVNIGVSQFGSGWVWLVKNADGRLEIIKTPNAETPLSDKSLTPLLTFDVWEHAYYLDYQNRRPDALKELWKIVNWRMVEKRYV